MNERSAVRASIAILALVAACANVPREQERDLAGLRETVSNRLGIEGLAASMDSEPELQREVERLLAEPLDDANAVRIALLSSPGARALWAELGVATAERIQAGRARNPRLSGDVLFSDEGTEIGLSIVQPFLDLVRAPARRRAAAAEYDAAEAQVARRLVELAFDVRRALVDARSARAGTLLARSAFETARSSFELMRELHAAGNVGDPALSAQEAELSSARIELIAAEAAEHETRERLSVLLGLPQAAGAWTVAGELGDAEFELPEAPAFEEHVLSVSFEYAAARRRVAAARATHALAVQRRYAPDLELGAAVKKEPSSSGWGVGPMVELELPVADAGDALSAGTRAKLALEHERARALELELRSAARLALARVDAAMDRLEVLREHHVPVHARLVTELLRTYNAMQIGVFQVLDARRAEIEARREQLDGRAEAARALLDFEELRAGARHGAHASAMESASTAPARVERKTTTTGGH